MEKRTTERVAHCPICGNRLFSTCVNADISIKCGRCNNQLHAKVISGSVMVDVTHKDDNKKTA